jgi:hypothetical protein
MSPPLITLLPMIAVIIAVIAWRLTGRLQITRTGFFVQGFKLRGKQDWIHDARNLLNSINLNLYLMRHSDPEQINKLILQCQEEVAALSKLLDADPFAAIASPNDKVCIAHGPLSPQYFQVWRRQTRPRKDGVLHEPQSNLNEREASARSRAV